MIQYLTTRQLNAFPLLRDTMFRDRAWQFHERLRWDVQVDENGHERDQYDALEPLYVVWQRPDGTHGGSMRFLPTTGRCMVNEHFLHLTGGRQINSAQIWECTRFCIAPGSSPDVSAALMLAGGEILQNMRLRQFVGVFDALMVRVYSRIGALPEVLGGIGQGRERISVGLWSFTGEAHQRLIEHSGISARQSRDWFDMAFADTRVALPLSA